jgi:hypothetical protein
LTQISLLRKLCSKRTTRFNKSTEEIMRRSVLMRFMLAVVVTTAWAAYANAQQFQAKLSGFLEIGPANAPTGAILTNGQGTLTVNTHPGSFTYTLTYSNLTTNVTQAHIHFGKIHVAGGIFAFLCTNLGNGPAGTPACPAAGGTVTGTITAASILAVPGQNVSAGDLAAAAAILNSNTAYGNVHTTKFPGGEIRGELRRPGDQDENQQR